jgi:hypothetical protein
VVSISLVLLSYHHHPQRIVSSELDHPRRSPSRQNASWFGRSTTMSSLHKLVDLDQPWLYASVGTILFNPIFWNLVARNGQSSGLACFSSVPCQPKADTTCKCNCSGSPRRRVQEQEHDQDVRWCLSRHLRPGVHHLYPRSL